MVPIQFSNNSVKGGDGEICHIFVLPKSKDGPSEDHSTS
jgi:hypothetical protein